MPRLADLSDLTRYKLFNSLWHIWHIRWRTFFDRFAPPCPTCARAAHKCHHAKYILQSRPWWHICCNGDSGGWRTTLCSRLEHNWRSTTEYNKEPTNAPK